MLNLPLFLSPVVLIFLPTAGTEPDLTNWHLCTLPQAGILALWDVSLHPCLCCRGETFLSPWLSDLWG